MSQETLISPAHPDVDQAIQAMVDRKWGIYVPGYEYNPTPEWTAHKDDMSHDGSDASDVATDLYAFETTWRDVASLELIDRLTGEVFTACNANVGRAMGESLREAHMILAGQAHRAVEEAGAELRKDERYQAFENFYLLLAGVATELGLEDYQDSIIKYAAHSFPDAVHAGKTRYGGQRNTYVVNFDGYYGAEEMHLPLGENPDDFLIDEDTLYHPTELTITADPGRRFTCSMRQRFTSVQGPMAQTVQLHDKEWQVRDFSVRLDKDPKSPTGYSLDIGRDAMRDEEQARPGDAVGRTLQCVRPEGSHFTAAFAGVSEAHVDEFIDNLARLLEADAEMARLDSFHRGRAAFSPEPRLDQQALRDAEDDQTTPETTAGSFLLPPGW